MKNIRTKGNKFSGIKTKEEIPVFPVTVTYTEPTATSMPKRVSKYRRSVNKKGKKSKSGFYWSEKHNKWIELL